jgi:hypothetical protein
MERFDETINELRSDVAATHGDELGKLIAQYGVGGVRHYLEQTKSHCVKVSLRDIFSEPRKTMRLAKEHRQEACARPAVGARENLRKPTRAQAL